MMARTDRQRGCATGVVGPVRVGTAAYLTDEAYESEGRLQKVEQLRLAIQAGGYRVATVDLAKAVMGAMLDWN